MDISNVNVNAARLNGTNGTAQAAAAASDTSILSAQKDTWSETDTSFRSGLAIAGEEPVSDEALSRNDALGNLISRAYGL